MRFSVASWHQHHADPQWWIDHNSYTTMCSPPPWARQANRNLDLFVPPARIVFGNVPEKEYRRVYRSVMRSRHQGVLDWIAAHDGEHVILLCACPEGQFCHRLLIAKLLKWLGCEEVPLPGEESESMEDIVVTVPLSFGLDTWIAEGDPAGAPWSGEEWHFYLGTLKPNVKPGGRVYVTYNGILRGYAPLVRVDVDYGSGADPIRLGHSGPPRYALVRHGGAVAVTIDEPVPGFRGFKARWWKREDERPFDAPWYDGRPAWTVPMEWSRQGWSPQLDLDWHAQHLHASHMGALFVDEYPVAGYWKEGGVWYCSKCPETFPAAKDAQAHIKASQDHIQRGVEFYVDLLAKRTEKEGALSR